MPPRPRIGAGSKRKAEEKAGGAEGGTPRGPKTPAKSLKPPVELQYEQEAPRWAGAAAAAARRRHQPPPPPPPSLLLRVLFTTPNLPLLAALCLAQAAGQSAGAAPGGAAVPPHTS